MGEEIKTFTQEQVNEIVQERLGREKKTFEGKLADYDETKKKLSEYEKSNSEKTQKELEEQKKYEELKKGWTEKEGNYQKIIAEKDGAISSATIDRHLSDEISKHNAYPEAKDVLRNIVVLDKDGMPKIKGKDAYGNDTLISLTDGVRKFLDERPHLVKAKAKAGGDTTTGGAGAGAEGSESLADLNTKFLQAINSGNQKLAGELKAKIQTYFTSKGVSRDM